VEHYDPPIQQPLQEYVDGWINAVRTLSSYNVGIYLHHANFDEVNLAVETEYTNLGLPGEHPKYWVLDVGPAFDTATSSPADLGNPL
jgi:hypothetical protein